jgi:excisionase family DNA binding protein
MDEYLTIQAAAAELGVTRDKVARLVKDGILPAEDSVLDKRKKLIPRASVVALMKREGIKSKEKGRER